MCKLNLNNRGQISYFSHFPLMYFFLLIPFYNGGGQYRTIDWYIPGTKPNFDILINQYDRHPCLLL
ncbi:MAG: hypothetical protein JWR38_2835 [Mucilaginibacter sp.]|nr:hypothetical protein [Mucilaginibacter sp.]